eukprot:g15994.t1
MPYALSNKYQLSSKFAQTGAAQNGAGGRVYREIEIPPRYMVAAEHGAPAFDVLGRMDAMTNANNMPVISDPYGPVPFWRTMNPIKHEQYGHGYGPYAFKDFTDYEKSKMAGEYRGAYVDRRHGYLAGGGVPVGGGGSPPFLGNRQNYYSPNQDYYLPGGAGGVGILPGGPGGFPIANTSTQDGGYELFPPNAKGYRVYPTVEDERRGYVPEIRIARLRQEQSMPRATWLSPEPHRPGAVPAHRNYLEDLEARNQVRRHDLFLNRHVGTPGIAAYYAGAGGPMAMGAAGASMQQQQFPTMQRRMPKAEGSGMKAAGEGMGSAVEGVLPSVMEGIDSGIASGYEHMDKSVTTTVKQRRR